MSAGYAYVVESFKGKQDGGEYAVLYYYTGYLYRGGITESYKTCSCKDSTQGSAQTNVQFHGSG